MDTLSFFVYLIFESKALDATIDTTYFNEKLKQVLSSKDSLTPTCHHVAETLRLFVVSCDIYTVQTEQKHPMHRTNRSTKPLAHLSDSLFIRELSEEIVSRLASLA
ncbi:hypothetical protein F2P81_025443 [Scophthalmus maximus]|uniref:Uncharacterized protein n=1 Tax=Scophthalmus maximus TaxID=52904 RepID=A0A6A4RQ42_SCOMX|nr:hypothetical protein F2P81_025443 [Scophthalmus maximus]